MKKEVTVLFTKFHILKQVYGSLSQYSSECDIIKNVKNLLK